MSCACHSLLLTLLMSLLLQAGAAQQEFQQEFQQENRPLLVEENRLLRSEIRHLTAALDTMSKAQESAIQTETEQLKAAADDETRLRQLETRRKSPQADADLATLASGLAADAVRMEADELRSDACDTPLHTCSLVKSAYGLALDSEADRMCSRHHLCVACSAAYDVPAEACDTVYVRDAAFACTEERDVAECGREADTLLDSMRRSHRPIDDVSVAVSACANRCAAAIFADVTKG